MEIVVFIPLIVVVIFYFIVFALCSLGAGAIISWIFSHFLIISIILWAIIIAGTIFIALACEGIRGVFLRTSQLGLFISSYMLLFSSLKEVSTMFEEKNILGLIIMLPLYICGTPFIAFIVQLLLLCFEILIELPFENRKIGLTIYSIFMTILNIPLSGALAIFVYYKFFIPN